MKLQVRQLAIAGLLGALVVVLGLTPLGFVPVPTPAGNATTIHIPVILAGVLEGPVVGGVVGLIFGIFSWVRNAMAPTNPVSAVLFADPLVTFVPRILIGVVSYYAYAAVRDRRGRDIVAALAGLLSFAASYSLWQKADSGLGGTLFSVALGLLVFAGAFLGQRRVQPAIAYATAAVLGVVFGVWVLFGVGPTWFIAWRILAAVAAAVAVGGAFAFAF
ncbi:MAG: ECF transporter S component, partial [Chloroflexota bacterium]